LAVYGVWTQDLVLARQMLHHLNHIPSPFLVVIFQVWSSVCAWGQPQTAVLLPMASHIFHIADITDMHHHSWLIGWDGISLTFCPGCPQTSILPISGGITGLSHHVWPGFSFMYVCMYLIYLFWDSIGVSLCSPGWLLPLPCEDWD
jgi:hypothetical protein